MSYVEFHLVETYKENSILGRQLNCCGIVLKVCNREQDEICFMTSLTGSMTLLMIVIAPWTTNASSVCETHIT